MHSRSHSTVASLPSTKPGDRCWISYLEEKGSAPLIEVELAWRAEGQVQRKEGSPV